MQGFPGSIFAVAKETQRGLEILGVERDKGSGSGGEVEKVIPSPGSGEESAPAPWVLPQKPSSQTSACTGIPVSTSLFLAFKSIPLPFLFSIKGSHDNHLKQLMSFRWASETGDQRDAGGGFFS